jgi:predicted CoA-binding protein
VNVSDKEILDTLKAYKKITVVGLSRDGSKPSQIVPLYAKSRGYEIVGVHPSEREIAGFQCYQKLSDVPEDFRKFVATY